MIRTLVLHGVLLAISLGLAARGPRAEGDDPPKLGGSCALYRVSSDVPHLSFPFSKRAIRACAVDGHGRFFAGVIKAGKGSQGRLVVWDLEAKREIHVQDLPSIGGAPLVRWTSSGLWVLANPGALYQWKADAAKVVEALPGRIDGLAQMDDVAGLVVHLEEGKLAYLNDEGKLRWRIPGKGFQEETPDQFLQAETGTLLHVNAEGLRLRDLVDGRTVVEASSTDLPGPFESPGETSRGLSELKRRVDARLLRAAIASHRAPGSRILEGGRTLTIHLWTSIESSALKIYDVDKGRLVRTEVYDECKEFPGLMPFWSLLPRLNREIQPSEIPGSLELRLTSSTSGSRSHPWSVDAHLGDVTSVDLAVGETSAASAGDDGMVKTWEARTGALRWSRSFRAEALRFSPDGRWIAAHGRRVLTVWETSTGSLKRRIRLGDSEDSASPRLAWVGQRLFLSGREGEMLALDVDSGSLRRIATGARRSLACMGVSQDGKRLAVLATHNGGAGHKALPRLMVLDSASLRVRIAMNSHQPEEGHEGLNEGGALQFSQDGTRVYWHSVSDCGGGHWSCVWDLKRGRALGPPSDEDGKGLEGIQDDSMRFSETHCAPDGRRVLSGGCANGNC